MTAELRIRRGVRAVLVDPDWQVLLVHFDFVREELPHGLWACPGGGLDEGESLEQGLVRELAEETGLRLTGPLDDPVWWKQHTMPMTHFDGQHDTYFWLQVEHFEPMPSLGFEQLRAEHVDAVRWWTYDDVMAAQRAYDADDRESPAYTAFSPRHLGHHLARLRQHGAPTTPLDVSGGERTAQRP